MTDFKQYEERFKRERRDWDLNPKHWSNNKRRRNNLPVLRKKLNKNRYKQYNPMRSPTMYELFNEVCVAIEKKIEESSSDFFKNFVSIKEIPYGGLNEYRDI